MARTAAVVRPLVVASHPHNNSLVVLLHGILSARFRAWEPVIDMIQGVYDARSNAFGSYDYYAFGYRSGIVQPPFETCFEPLRQLMARPRYDTVVLIGHSQGGVLAKLFLIDELQRGRLGQCKVDLVITLDTPHTGPQPWIYPVVLLGALWKRVPLLNRVPVWRQAADLARWSPSLARLRREWNATNFPGRPCAASATRRHLRSYTVSGAPLPLLGVKGVVSKASAHGFEIDEPIAGDAPPGLGIGHGVAAMANYRQQIQRLLAEHDAKNVRRLRTEIPAIDAAVLSSLLSAFCDPAALPCETETWRRRLVAGFPGRPLRAIADPVRAAEKFITLRRGDP